MRGSFGGWPANTDARLAMDRIAALRGGVPARTTLGTHRCAATLIPLVRVSAVGQRPLNGRWDAGAALSSGPAQETPHGAGTSSHAVCITAARVVAWAAGGVVCPGRGMGGVHGGGEPAKALGLVKVAPLARRALARSYPPITTQYRALAVWAAHGWYMCGKWGRDGPSRMRGQPYLPFKLAGPHAPPRHAPRPCGGVTAGLGPVPTHVRRHVTHGAGPIGEGGRAGGWLAHRGVGDNWPVSRELVPDDVMCHGEMV
jgi:hypothetical protein